MFEFDGVRVFVDPKSLIYLAGTVLDYKNELMQQGFVFQNPSAGKSCSCGCIVLRLAGRYGVLEGGFLARRFGPIAESAGARLAAGSVADAMERQTPTSILCSEEY